MSNHLKSWKNISEKSILAFICLVFLFSVLSGCNLSRDNRHGLDKNDIESVNINIYNSIRHSKFNDIETNDKDEISNLIEYFSSLTTTETDKKNNSHDGIFLIRMKLKDGEERIFFLCNNTLFGEAEYGHGIKFTYEIPYEQGVNLKKVAGEIARKEQIKLGNPSVSGTVISLNFTSNARIISCIIKDKSNKTYEFSVQNAKIINVTGKKWANLFEKDVIEVFYQKDKKSSTETYIATTIIIYESEYSP